MGAINDQEGHVAQVTADGRLLVSVDNTGGLMGVQDEGVLLPLRGNVNFIGEGVTATDNVGNGRTDVTILSSPHPDLASHDGLGLATDAELIAHAATPHGTPHPDLAGHDALGLATDAETVHLTGAELITGAKTIQAPAVGSVPLIVKGLAGQTADLTQWQDSAGLINARIAADGSMFMGERATNTAVSPQFVARSRIAGYTAEVYNHGSNAVAQLSVGTAGSASNPSHQLKGSSSAYPVAMITAMHAGSIPLIARGTTAQTADLQQWQDSAGVVQASITSGGILTLPVTGRISGPSGVVNLGSGSVAAISARAQPSAGLAAAMVDSYAGAVTCITLIARAHATQTGDIQQWQDSAGTAIVGVTWNGFVKTGYVVSAGNAGSYLRLDGNSALILGRTAASPTFIAQGVASQTADLQQWQNSAGTVLARIESNGSFISTIDVTANNRLKASQYYPTNTARTFILEDAAAQSRHVFGTTAAVVGLVLKGAVAQTANLQQWQNSAGTVLAHVTDAGVIHSGNVQMGAGGNDINNIAASMRFYSAAAIIARTRFEIGTSGEVGAANVPLVVRGTAAQTANLQEWQNSAGTVLARVTSGGFVSSGLGYFGGSTLADPESIGDGAVRVSPRAATGVGVLIRGRVSQTADLQQWQNDTGTVLSRVRSDGAMFVPVLAAQSTTADLFMGDTADTGRVFFRRAATFQSPAVATVPLMVRAVAGQTGNLQEWIDTGSAVALAVLANGNLEFTANTRGPILRSPAGTRYRVTVDDAGALSTVAA